MSNVTQYIDLLEERAKRLDLTIVEMGMEELEGDKYAFGPYVLRCAVTGYDAHMAGVDLENIALQLNQIEAE